MGNNNRLGDRNVRHDRFHQQAKREGFRARAVFKLQEIDAQYNLFKPGDRVLDLGCSPGSWLQYARSRIGERGVLVGIDRTELRPGVPGARLMVGDVLTIDTAELLGGLDGFDVVLSDMAPDTSGIRSMDQARSEALFERALEIAEQTLAPGGNFVGKIFQGPEFKRLIDRVRAGFSVGKAAKPDSSRKISIEQFVVGAGFRGNARKLAPVVQQSATGAQTRGAVHNPVVSDLAAMHRSSLPAVVTLVAAPVVAADNGRLMPHAGAVTRAPRPAAAKPTATAKPAKSKITAAKPTTVNPSAKATAVKPKAKPLTVKPKATPTTVKAKAAAPKRKPTVKAQPAAKAAKSRTRKSRS